MARVSQASDWVDFFKKILGGPFPIGEPAGNL